MYHGLSAASRKTLRRNIAHTATHVALTALPAVPESVVLWIFRSVGHGPRDGLHTVDGIGDGLTPAHRKRRDVRRTAGLSLLAKNP